LHSGFKEIFKKDFDAVIIMDGDGQHDPIEIPRFIQKCKEGNIDLILGNRVKKKNMPFIRRLTNKFMSSIISSIVGQKIPDSQCGFRLIKRGILKKIDIKASNFEIESEIIIKAWRMGGRIVSIPISTIYRREKSKIKPMVDAIRFLKLIIKDGIS